MSTAQLSSRFWIFDFGGQCSSLLQIPRTLSGIFAPRYTIDSSGYGTCDQLNTGSLWTQDTVSSEPYCVLRYVHIFHAYMVSLLTRASDFSGRSKSPSFSRTRKWNSPFQALRLLMRAGSGVQVWVEENSTHLPRLSCRATMPVFDSVVCLIHTSCFFLVFIFVFCLVARLAGLHEPGRQQPERPDNPERSVDIAASEEEPQSSMFRCSSFQMHNGFLGISGLVVRCNGVYSTMYWTTICIAEPRGGLVGTVSSVPRSQAAHPKSRLVEPFCRVDRVSFPKRSDAALAKMSLFDTQNMLTPGALGSQAGCAKSRGSFDTASG
ncbi:hypothetical protein PDE_00557 [Penicillium oxalicum 114-2]|uniref:Uncharacterized protein n=1 Tax=Penicillium oxalicum (strain 114-2 / CGMCC 5302) TaxID=933388 RepID=S8AIN0_PENO1|nr:hypothetical protein PDE_00557 [Penicillium oxalicum 114-2]